MLQEQISICKSNFYLYCIYMSLFLCAWNKSSVFQHALTQEECSQPQLESIDVPTSQMYYNDWTHRYTQHVHVSGQKRSPSHRFPPPDFPSIFLSLAHTPHSKLLFPCSASSGLLSLFLYYSAAVSFPALPRSTEWQGSHSCMSGGVRIKALGW